jgi:hypothetical protein
MVKKNHNLDTFFKKKLTGYEAPEQKGNWQLLNHLLEERERRKRIAWRIFFGSLFLVFLFISYIIFVSSNKENNRVAVNNKNSGSVVPSASVADSTLNESSGNGKTPVNENNTAAEASAGNASENKNVAEASKNIVEAAQVNTKKMASKNTPAKQTNRAVQVAKMENQRKPAPANSKNEKLPSNANVDVNLSKKESVIPSNKNAKAEEKEITTPEIARNDIDNVGVEDSAIAAQPVAEISVPDTVAVNAPKDSAAKNSVSDTSKARSKTLSVPFFNVHAGLNLYRTQSQSLSDERHVSPLVGIELMYPLSQHFSAGVGAIYSLQAGYHLSDTSTQVTYFLEKNVSQQVILIRKQHKVYVPLTLYYHVSDRHVISCGVQWSYLVNTVGDYSEIKTTSGNTTQSKRDNVKGYMDGIKSSALSLSVGYRFSLSKKFDISARAIQDVSDSYTPQYFYGVNASPSWSLLTFLSVKF